MSEKHDELDHGQLDNGWHLYVTLLIIAYFVILFVAGEAGLTIPEWIPAWVLALPPLAAFFWWVPIVMLLALVYIHRKISFRGFGG